MVRPAADPVTFPVRRSRPFDPPEEYRRLRAECPVSRLRLAGGKVGWLVTRYDDVRAVIADPRLTPPLAQVIPVEELPLGEEELQVPPGTFSALAPPDHGRYRKLATPPFTLRRVRQLVPTIERLVDERLAIMARSGPPVDLVEAFAMPISLTVMSEVLGVPVASRAPFARATGTMFSLTATGDQLRAAREQVYQGMGRLVRAKHAKPGEDLLSRHPRGQRAHR